MCWTTASSKPPQISILKNVQIRHKTFNFFFGSVLHKVKSAMEKNAEIQREPAMKFDADNTGIRVCPDGVLTWRTVTSLRGV
jgi:hypothetical protein